MNDNRPATPSPMVEMLAKMWIECDPNRTGGQIGSGFHPDDPIQMHDQRGDVHEVPRWHWFIPRAEATLAYLDERGFQIVPKGEAQS